MATGQTLLNLAELLMPELQLQTGEADTARGLIALNAAQDILESLLASEADVAGSSVSTLVTVASQEWTTFPSGVMRLDRLQFINPTSLLPDWDLINRKRVGGHRRGETWLTTLSSSTEGKPREYWTNGTRIYWNPVPDAVHTIRWYGFQSAADITAAATFSAYPEMAYLPLATLACKILKAGLDDETGNLDAVAKATLGPVLEAMRRFNRDGPVPYEYAFHHDT